MRIIARSTLKKFWEENPTAEQPLLAWADEAENAD
jgi:mRNA interferase HigB